MSSSITSSTHDYLTFDKEFDMDEEEDIAMVVALHKNKRLIHGGTVFQS
jgi:hypothetical protein